MTKYGEDDKPTEDTCSTVDERNHHSVPTNGNHEKNMKTFKPISCLKFSEKPQTVSTQVNNFWKVVVMILGDWPVFVTLIHWKYIYLYFVVSELYIKENNGIFIKKRQKARFLPSSPLWQRIRSHRCVWLIREQLGPQVNASTWNKTNIKDEFNDT